MERSIVHDLVELAPLAWSGPECDRAIGRLRARLVELQVAAIGLRTTADHVAGSEARR